MPHIWQSPEPRIDEFSGPDKLALSHSGNGCMAIAVINGCKALGDPGWRMWTALTGIWHMQVFDGHCGAGASHFARDNLLQFLKESDNFPHAAQTSLVQPAPSSIGHMMLLRQVFGLTLHNLHADDLPGMNS